MRYCECGRELEKHCTYCSECSYINETISKDIYATTEAGKASRARADKKWREKNKEYVRAYHKEYRIKNKEQLNEYQRKYYLRHKEAV